MEHLLQRIIDRIYQHGDIDAVRDEALVEEIEEAIENHTVSMEEAYETYEEVSCRVRERWEKLIGFGCGWFGSYSINEDNVIVTYERPRNGGRDRDIIPIKYFEIENEEEARKAWMEFLKERRKNNGKEKI